MGNRQVAQSFIIKGLKDIDPSGKNAKLAQEMFDGMSDSEFDVYMSRIEKGEDYVSALYTNLEKSAITTDNNLKVAEKWGVKLFQQIWTTDSSTGRTYLTPIPYPIIYLPVRRQIEMLKKKISVPDDNLHIDDLTDQPTGVSKGSSVSLPETLILYSRGLDDVITELMKYRGGDTKGMAELERSIRDTGEANMAFLMQTPTRVKSTKTFSTLLKGMHFDNNF